MTVGGSSAPPKPSTPPVTAQSNTKSTSKPTSKSTGGKPTSAPAAAAPAAAALDEDLDDIFGDGVGSDYVCEPSAEQLAKVERAKVEAAVMRSATRADDVNRRWGAEQAAMEVADADADRIAPPLAVDDDEGDSDENALLKKALAKGGRLHGDTTSSSSSVSQPEARAAGGKGGKGGKIAGAASMVLVEEEDMDDEALLQAAKGGLLSAPAVPKTAGKDLKMAATDDSYEELFPDTYQGYAKSLQLGPDEDEEQGIVRSKDEPVEEETAGGKVKGKRAAIDKEKVEAAKRTAKEDRELAAIEKLMEERALKRQRRDETGE